MAGRHPSPRALLAAALIGALALSGALAACGGSDVGGAPRIGRKADDKQAGRALGFPTFATKNTTRVGGADATADAAAVAQATFSAQSPTTRPDAVTLVDRDAWQAGIAAAVLVASPVRSPVLLTDGGDLPHASEDALATLDPRGSKLADDAQVIRIGDVAKPGGRRSTHVEGASPYELAVGIDRLRASAEGHTSDVVVIASGERPEFAMPAAAWAAKSGNPVLFVKRDEIPKETRTQLLAHQQPKIYLLGPRSVISAKVETQLRKLGTVRRVSGETASTNAIAFARFRDGAFGWGVVDPGHGLVLASARRPLDAAAAAPLSASGTYGPLLLDNGDGVVNDSVVQYLLDIQPGYDRDPVRGVYNHAWLIGDEKVLSTAAQGRIDTLLEIQPVSTQKAPS
jgi:hypothetical protein